MTKLADVLMTGAVFKPDAAQAVQLYSRAVREGETR